MDGQIECQVHERNLVCLGGDTGRVRLVMELPWKRFGTEEHPPFVLAS
jgi:hypothetical protein